MNLSDLNNLDFNNIGSWPIPAKAAFIGIAVALVVGLGVYFFTLPQLATLESAKREEVQLKATYEKLEQKAANLDLYRQQMNEVREAFAVMLRQLPRKAEVEELLVEISQTGLAAGLEFELFKPGTGSAVEFYDLPIEIRVIGRYHEFGQFVSGVAALPRIVTLHNVAIISKRGDNEDGELAMDVTAKIYHYRDIEEEE